MNMLLTSLLYNPSQIGIATRRIRRELGIIASILFLSACATSPEFNLTGVIQNKTPKQLIDQFESLRNNNILIGGTIVNNTDTNSGTQLEILAYPLDTNNYPRIENETSGRFLARNAGLLDRASFAPGKQVTLTGKLTSVVTGKLGDADYSYPILDINQIFLWTPDSGGGLQNVDTHLHIGIGVFMRR